MTSPDELRKQLDACRPEHADWNEPELTALADALARDESLVEQQLASQVFDRAVQSQIEDVPVPQGLAERILARLTAEEVSVQEESVQNDTDERELGREVFSAVSTATSSTSLSPASQLPGTSEPTRSSRSQARRSWAVAGLASILVVVLAAYWFRPTVTPPESADQLAQVATQWGESLAEAPGWRKDLGAAPQRYGFSRQVRAKVTGWLSLESPYDRQGVAYALRGPLSDGWLVVQRTSASFLVNDDLPRPLPTTGPWAVHAWREGELLFVLVARNRPQHSDQFLAPRELAGVFKPTHVRPLPQPKSVDDGCAA